MFSRKLLKYIALFLTSFLLTVSLVSCAGQLPSVKSSKIDTSAAAIKLPAASDSESSLNKILEKKEIRIAVPDDFPPFGSIGPDMQVRGYDIDVADQVAQKLGVELKLIPVIGNYRIPFLQTNRVDLVISSLGKNKDREKIISFSIPYAPFYSGVYGRKDLSVSSTEDLKGHTVGVAQGSLEDLELAKLPQTFTIKRFANNSLTASALISEQVELIATGNVVANKLIKDNPDEGIENKFVMKNSPCYVGFRKGDILLEERVNSILMELRKSGELDKLAVKWFGEPLGNLPTS